jgi:hypothetical protein
MEIWMQTFTGHEINIFLSNTCLFKKKALIQNTEYNICIFGYDGVSQLLAAQFI